MKQALLIVVLSGAALPLLGQGLINQGAVITIQAGAQVSVVGDVRISTSGTIDNAGTLSLTGNWENNASNTALSAATGTVQLVGTTEQQVGGSTPTLFHDLNVSGAAGPVKLTNDISVGSSGGVFTLGPTRVQLSSRTLTLANGAASALSRTTGMLVTETAATPGYGRVVWLIGANTGSYIIPLGSATTALPLTAVISGAGSSNGSLSFTTYPTPANNLPLPAGVSALQGDANYALDRFWVVQPNNYTLAPAATLTLPYQEAEWSAAPNTIVESRLRLQRWNGTNWEAPQGTVNTTENTITTDLQNTYGIFAATDLSRPLPVQLREFTAVAQGSNGVLSWSTVQELNNKGFEVEVSLDGKQFQRLGFVAGHGTSNTSHQYRYLDAGAARRGHRQYYRLRQLDQNGAADYSPVKPITFEGISGATLAAWPNPAHDTYTLVLTAARAQTAALTVHDVLGREVGRFSLPLQPGENRLPAAFTSTQPVGVYLLSTVVDGQVLRTRLVRE